MWTSTSCLIIASSVCCSWSWAWLLYWWTMSQSMSCRHSGKSSFVSFKRGLNVGLWGQNVPVCYDANTYVKMAQVWFISFLFILALLVLGWERVDGRYSAVVSSFRIRVFLLCQLILMIDLSEHVSAWVCVVELLISPAFFLVLCSTVFHNIRPQRVPGFAYGWLELVSHRVMLSKLLGASNQKVGHANLLIALLFRTSLGDEPSDLPQKRPPTVVTFFACIVFHWLN